LSHLHRNHLSAPVNAQPSCTAKLLVFEHQQLALTIAEDTHASTGAQEMQKFQHAQSEQLLFKLSTSREECVSRLSHKKTASHLYPCLRQLKLFVMIEANV